MGAFLPVFLALCLNFYNIFVFGEIISDSTPGPIISTYMFMVSIFLLLWTIRLYPQSLRRIWIGEKFIEFLVCQYLMELSIIQFWFPLESTIVESLPKLADSLNEIMQKVQLNSQTIDDILKSDITPMVFSYLLSGFFLITALHATRVINLCELEYGLNVFMYHILSKLRKFYHKTVKQVTNGKTRVEFQNDPCDCLAKLRKPSKSYSEDFSDDFDEPF